MRLLHKIVEARNALGAAGGVGADAVIEADERVWREIAGELADYGMPIWERQYLGVGVLFGVRLPEPMRRCLRDEKVETILRAIRLSGATLYGLRCKVSGRPGLRLSGAGRSVEVKLLGGEG